MEQMMTGMLEKEKLIVIKKNNNRKEDDKDKRKERTEMKDNCQQASHPASRTAAQRH